MLALRNSTAMLVACLLASCANVVNVARLQPGISTAADASRVAHREPGHTWDNANGTRTLEYSNQPLDGFNCFMVTVDAAGIVLKVEQTITDANMEKIQKGLSREQVRRILGEPRTTQYFPLSHEEIWDWNISTDVDTIIRFNAHFDGDTVKRTSTRRVDLSGCFLGCN